MKIIAQQSKMDEDTIEFLHKDRSEWQMFVTTPVAGGPRIQPVREKSSWSVAQHALQKEFAAQADKNDMILKKDSLKSVAAVCGMVWYGTVRYGTVRYGTVPYGMVWYGMVWYGMVWYGMVWYGMVWYGMVWYGMVWYGMVWYGMVWQACKKIDD